MSEIGKKITSRSCLTEAILMIREKEVGFKMFKKVRVKKELKDFGNGRSKSYRTVVGRVRMVTLLWNRLNQGMLPGFRVGGGFEYETKKTAKNWCYTLFKSSVSNITYHTGRKHPTVSWA